MSQCSDIPDVVTSDLPARPLAPVSDTDRIRAIDVLRGFALLGILPVNMIAFAHIPAAYQSPDVAGGFTGLNYLTWAFTHLIFASKMVTLFSMLFGVGLFLQVDRAEKIQGRVGAARGLYFRRVGWLLLFGLIHAYLFWYGDVLTYYAVVGMLVYWLRRLRPRTLLILGIILFLFGSMIIYSLSLVIDSATEHVKQHPELVQEARELRDMQEGFHPSPAKAEEEASRVRKAGWWELVKIRAGFTVQFQIMGLVTFNLWNFSGLMLFGIALFKLGAFDLQWNQKRYWLWFLIGMGAGLPLTLISIWQHQDVAGMTDALRIMATSDYFGSIMMAAGYLGLILLMVKQGWLPALQARLAAVGQMAFTNYLSHTLVCTFIFHGWGLSQFGTWPRTELLLLAVTIWILQLIISPIWLQYFRFGPCEWLWRTLSYLQWQPMLRRQSK